MKRLCLVLLLWLAWSAAPSSAQRPRLLRRLEQVVHHEHGEAARPAHDGPLFVGVLLLFGAATVALVWSVRRAARRVRREREQAYLKQRLSCSERLLLELDEQTEQ